MRFNPRNTLILLVTCIGVFDPDALRGQVDTVAAQAAWSRTSQTVQSLTDASAAGALLSSSRGADLWLRQPAALAAVLDTAASRVSGMAYRTAWGGYAFAHALQAAHGSCGPLDSVSLRRFLDWCRRAFDAYLGTFERDSAFAPTISDLDLIVPYPQLWASTSRELSAVEGALARGGIPPATRHRLERLRLLLTLEGGDVNVARHLLGKSAPEALTSGERSYLSAFVTAALGDPEEATRLYAQASADSGAGEQSSWVARDVALVGGTTDSAAFVSLPQHERGKWIEAFWFDRDFEDGHPPGTRFVEHARRWRRVLGHYRLFDGDNLLRMLPPDPARAQAACREAGDRANASDGSPFCMSNVRDLRKRLLDDRGLVFLRHGDPQRRANYPGLQQMTTESWLYTFRERSAFMHFTEIPGLSGMLSSPLATGDWIATCELSALYCVLDARKSLKSLSQERIVRVRELAELDQVYLATHDDAPQRFDQKLRMAVTGTGLGRSRGTMTVAADISMRDLMRYGTSDSVHLSLRWQIRVRNSAKEWVVSLDTIRRFRLPSMGGDSTKDAFLTAMVEVPVPPGMHELKVVISDSAGRVGAEYSRSGMAVGDPAATTDLSDLVLLPDGGQGVPASIEGNAVRVSPALSPGRARFMGVGFILSGAADREVPLTVTVTQLDKDDAAPVVKLRFAERPESARAFRLLRVGIGALKSGSYELRVAAEFAADRIVERTQRLVVP